jgi:hypothetical protein
MSHRRNCVKLRRSIGVEGGESQFSPWRNGEELSGQEKPWAEKEEIVSFVRVKSSQDYNRLTRLFWVLCLTHTKTHKEAPFY